MCEADTDTVFVMWNPHVLLAALAFVSALPAHDATHIIPAKTRSSITCLRRTAAVRRRRFSLCVSLL